MKLVGLLVTLQYSIHFVEVIFTPSSKIVPQHHAATNMLDIWLSLRVALTPPNIVLVTVVFSCFNRNCEHKSSVFETLLVHADVKPD